LKLSRKLEHGSVKNYNSFNKDSVETHYSSRMAKAFCFKNIKNAESLSTQESYPKSGQAFEPKIPARPIIKIPRDKSDTNSINLKSSSSPKNQLEM